MTGNYCSQETENVRADHSFDLSCFAQQMPAAAAVR